MAVSGVPGDQAFGRGLLELLVAGAPMAAGIEALGAPLDARFGVALIVLSLAWSLTALSETSASVPYTIGRLTTPLVPLSVYDLLLVFPDVRVAHGFDRAVCAAVLVLAAVFFFGTASFVEAFPVHTPWATCVTDCPDNALFVLNRQPAVMADVVIPLREWLLIAVLTGSASMIRRWRAASPLRERAMGPVVAMGLAMAAARPRCRSPGRRTLRGRSWTRWGRVARVRRRRRGRVPVRPVARPTAPSATSPTPLSCVTRSRRARRPGGGVAAARRELWRLARQRTTRAARTPGAAAVSSRAIAGWRHGRVVSDLAKATAELQKSRQRIAEGADLERARIERARIERDLHDGAQQRLIAVRPA